MPWWSAFSTCKGTTLCKTGQTSLHTWKEHSSSQTIHKNLPHQLFIKLMPLLQWGTRANARVGSESRLSVCHFCNCLWHHLIGCCRCNCHGDSGHACLLTVRDWPCVELRLREHRIRLWIMQCQCCLGTGFPLALQATVKCKMNKILPFSSLEENKIHPAPGVMILQEYIFDSIVRYVVFICVTEKHRTPINTFFNYLVCVISLIHFSSS